MMEKLEYNYGVEALFEADFRDAEAYNRRAIQFRDAGQAYSVVFNIASVALERYLVALCEFYGEEPVNHNFISLMICVEKLISVPKELSRGVKSLDKIFGICFLDQYYHGVPLPEDARKVLRLCDEVKALFDEGKIASLKKK